MDINVDINKMLEGVSAPEFTDEEMKKPQATMIQDITDTAYYIHQMSNIEEKAMYISLLMASIRVIKDKCAMIIENTQQSEENLKFTAPINIKNDEPQMFFD